MRFYCCFFFWYAHKHHLCPTYWRWCADSLLLATEIVLIILFLQISILSCLFTAFLTLMKMGQIFIFIKALRNFPYCRYGIFLKAHQRSYHNFSIIVATYLKSLMHIANAILRYFCSCLFFSYRIEIVILMNTALLLFRNLISFDFESKEMRFRY